VIGGLPIAAAAGGAFGASLGALPSFVFTWFVVSLREGLAILEHRPVGFDVAPSGDLATGVTSVTGVGMVTGPHVAFAGGVAAAAYAGKRHPALEPERWKYYPGKNIGAAFGSAHDILAVGAVFGVLGTLNTRIASAFDGITGVVGETAQRVCYAHGGTHVDPSAVATGVGTFAVAVLQLVGMVSDAGYL